MIAEKHISKNINKFTEIVEKENSFQDFIQEAEKRNLVNNPFVYSQLLYQGDLKQYFNTFDNHGIDSLMSSSNNNSSWSICFVKQDKLLSSDEKMYMIVEKYIGKNIKIFTEILQRVNSSQEFMREAERRNLVNNPLVYSQLLYQEDLYQYFNTFANHGIDYLMFSSDKITVNGENISEWMLFFVKLGKLLSKEKKINIYLSFIDERIPLLFILLGIIESEFKRMSSISDKEIEKLLISQSKNYPVIKVNQGNNFEELHEIFFIDKANNQTESTRFLEGLTYGKNKTKIKNQIRKDKWKHMIRVQGDTRNKKKKVVNFISPRIKTFFGEETANIIQMLNLINVNLIGSGIYKYLDMYSDYFELAYKGKKFNFKDLIYVNDERYNVLNYQNVRLVNSINKTPIKDNETVSIFLGANSGIRFSEYRTEKNIIVSSRKKMTRINDETLIGMLKTESMTSSNKKMSILKTEEIFELIKEIPKGVELIVW